MPKAPKQNEVACPMCKEPVALKARICPHCRTEFSDEEIAARVKRYRMSLLGGCGLMLVLLIAIVIWLSSGGDGKSAAGNANDGAAAEGAPAQSPKEAAKVFYVTLFKTLGVCDDAGTETAKISKAMLEGNATVYDGYRVATEQVKACQQSEELFTELTIPAALNGDLHDAAEKAKDTCKGAASLKRQGGQTLAEFLDGENKPSKLEELRQFANGAQMGVTLCAAAAIDMAGKAGIEANDLPNLK